MVNPCMDSCICIQLLSRTLKNRVTYFMEIISQLKGKEGEEEVQERNGMSFPELSVQAEYGWLLGML